MIENGEESRTTIQLASRTKGRVTLQSKETKFKWLVGLISLAIVYLTIIVLVAGLKLRTSSVLPSAVVVVSFLFVVFSIYVAIKNRQIGSLTTSLCVVGALFIVIGSMVLMPYTTIQTYRTESGAHITSGIGPLDYSYVWPTYNNGTLRLLNLPSNTSKSFGLGGYISPVNTSILQIEISTSDLITFVMKSWRPDTDEIFLNETIDTGNYTGGQAGVNWVTRFWTPPRSLSMYNLGFYFTNPNIHDVNFYFRVTDFDLNATAYSVITTYKPWGDPNLPYVGLSMIGTAVAFQIFSLRKQDTKPLKDEEPLTRA